VTPRNIFSQELLIKPLTIQFNAQTFHENAVASVSQFTLSVNAINKGERFNMHIKTSV